MQVSVLVDETYAPDPTQYNLASFYSAYNITPADNSSFSFLQNSSVFRSGSTPFDYRCHSKAVPDQLMRFANV